MKNHRIRLMAVAVAFTASLMLASTAGTAGTSSVTFTKDVAPILYNRCIECHRPGEIAPMSLMTYQEVRPWARSIRERVVERSMPPRNAL